MAKEGIAHYGRTRVYLFEKTSKSSKGKFDSLDFSENKGISEGS